MKPELLAPCRDWPTLKAAVENGADAVYFGVKKFNMRMKTKNFTIRELSKITKYCHENNVKCYLTTNIIIYENELKQIEQLLIKAKNAKIDAVIVHDLAVISIAKKLKLKFHISTQASISNSKSANMYYKLGASRAILARECQLKQIKKIAKNSKLPIEIFIHGAMCVSVSGRCFFSQTMYGKSANRGECMQPCRQKWIVKNKDGEFIYDGERFLNAKDLCMIEHIPKLLKSGAISFKIEGRMKDANYVATVVKVYREAIDNFKKSKVKNWLKQLKSVYNRGFSTGFYFGIPVEEVAKSHGSIATHKKVNIGVVKNYYSKQKAAKIKLIHSGLKIGDTIIIEGKTTFVKQTVESMHIKNTSIKQSKKGQIIALKVNKKVRENDQIYRLKKV